MFTRVSPCLPRWIHLVSTICWANECTLIQQKYWTKVLIHSILYFSPSAIRVILYSYEFMAYVLLIVYTHIHIHIYIQYTVHTYIYQYTYAHTSDMNDLHKWTNVYFLFDFDYIWLSNITWLLLYYIQVRSLLRHFR